jgi:hypothetical protein
MALDAPKMDDRPAVVAQVAQGPDHLNKFDEYRLGIPPAVGATKLPEAKDIGQVADMKLPAGFVPGAQRDGGSGSNSFFQEYHSGADPSLQVYFEYRGHRMSQDASTKFHQALAAAPHNLSQTELKSLGELLQGKSDPGDFQISTAKTQDVSGKRVLLVEGDYVNQTPPLRARTLYVDSDGTGSAVQEITFQAPTSSFNKNIVQGTRSLDSITWK